MRILFLTQILPYPPNAGPRVKTWHVLRHLAQQGHQITLLTFIREEEKEFVPRVAEICEKVITVPIKRSRIKDAGYFIQSLFGATPFLIRRDNLANMRAALREVVSRQPFDIIHADQVSMAQFAWLAKQQILNEQISSPEEKTPALIFDAHNATWTILQRMQQQVPWLLRPLVKHETSSLQRYEGWLIQNFDHTLAVTTIDRDALLSADSSADNLQNQISVIPIAVDTKEIAPLPFNQQANQIVTLGTLHYPPNADGIRWFMREVYPLVIEKNPAATLTVIGKNPPPDFQQIAQQFPGRITISGYVPDLLPYLEQAAVLVVPVLAGGGMRVRILEAFSRRLAVVTTTIGLEGIDAKKGEQVLVGDTPIQFAEAVNSLLADAALRKKIAFGGRLLVEEKYDWQVVFSALNKVYQQTLARSAALNPIHESDS